MGSILLPVRAAVLMFRHKQLIKVAMLPWLLNLVVFIFSMGAFIWLDRRVMTRLEAWMGAHWWTPVITWTLGIVLMLAFGAGLVLSFTYLLNIVAGVFAEQLSMHTEAVLTGRMIESPEGSFGRIWLRSAVEELKGILFFLAVWLALLALNLIPVAGTVLFMVLSWCWTAVSMAFEFTAPAAERHGMRFREKRRMIFREPFKSGMLGTGILILTWIPVLNLFFYPFAVVSGTIWMVENGFPAETG